MIRDPETFGRLLADVRRFVRTECIPLEASVDQSDEIPEALVQRMREHRPVRPQHSRGLRRRRPELPRNCRW